MKPVEVRRERVVSLPVEVVWQIVEPATTMPSWLPMATRVELLSGKGLGRRQRMHAKQGGGEIAIEQTVTAYTSESLLTWKHADSDVSVTVRLESVGPATRVVLESRTTPASATAALVHRFVTAKRIRKSFDIALARLAAAGGM